MTQRPLPPRAVLADFEKQAKELLARVGRGDPEALAAVTAEHPRAAAAIRGFAVSDARLVVARLHGAPSWPRLRRDLVVVERYRWEPPRDPAVEEGSPADRFLRLACVSYGAWSLAHAAEARAMLAAEPALARASLAVAAAVGDVEGVRAVLAISPAAATVRGGPYGWEPLLYLCYSRVQLPEGDAVEAARLLLAGGADPNAGFLWEGHSPPFTALTGAFGGGEDGVNQVPHPQSEALARVLLAAGADPNDGQTLYNRHFRPDDRHLEILLAHGLGVPTGGPWFERLAERLAAPEVLLSESLWSAARAGYEGRVRLLLAHGVDVNRPGERDGRTPWEVATLAGRDAIVTLLEGHGARPGRLGPTDRLLVACLAGDEAAARRLYAEVGPGLDSGARVTLVHRAVEASKVEAVRILVGLGFPVDGATEHDGVGVNLGVSPLHNAAWAGDLGMVQALVELGADVHAQDPTYRATPAGWAAHNGKDAVAAWLEGAGGSRGA